MITTHEAVRRFGRFSGFRAGDCGAICDGCFKVREYRQEWWARQGLNL
jgi:hypothetical protein